MGLRLVQAAAVLGRHLKGNEFKLLVHMSLVALDRPNEKGQPADLFWGGWESLACALGQDVPRESDDASRRRRKTQAELVARAVRGLERQGLIKRQEEHPRSGVRQTIRLTFSHPKSAGQEPLQTRGARSPQIGGAEALQSVSTSPADSAGPRKQKDLKKDLSEDPTIIPPPARPLDGRTGLIETRRWPPSTRPTAGHLRADDPPSQVNERLARLDLTERKATST